VRRKRAATSWLFRSRRARWAQALAWHRACARSSCGRNRTTSAKKKTRARHQNGDMGYIINGAAAVSLSFFNVGRWRGAVASFRARLFIVPSAVKHLLCKAPNIKTYHLHHLRHHRVGNAAAALYADARVCPLTALALGEDLRSLKMARHRRRRLRAAGGSSNPAIWR